MQPISIDLCDSLYDTANNIVGFVAGKYDGADTPTGESFIECVIPFENENQVIEKWVEFIKAYLVVSKYTFTGSVSQIDNPLKIYWRVLPEYKYEESRKLYLFYARFLISNSEPRELS